MSKFKEIGKIIRVYLIAAPIMAICAFSMDSKTIDVF